MSDSPRRFVFLSGAGGGAPDFGAFREGIDDTTRFEVISYPGWRRYVADDFSAEALVAELAARIVEAIPEGPIFIIGLSIGGHLGYAIALLLKKQGREIAGLCAIDSFMITSVEPSAGWKGRALEQGIELLRKRQINEFARFVRSKFWRLLVRLAGSRLPMLVQRFNNGRSSSISSIDPVFEEELSMRLLVRETAPWLAKLDEKSVALDAPVVLLRTPLTAVDDANWRRRCPAIKIFEISGQHHNLFEPENIGTLRQAFLTSTREWQ
jgi:thioesterase domain-containing protein